MAGKDNRYVKEDISEICSYLQSMSQIEDLRNSYVLITGATGLIGSFAVKSLYALNEKMNLNIHILALIRNWGKVKEIFGDEYLKMNNIKFICADILKPIKVEEPVNYIIHGAAVTTSKIMVNKPVETLNTAIIGTDNVLKLACEKKISSMVYLSSMEMYGNMANDKPVKEEDIGYIDPLALRSNYPESKRLCENMCIAWLSEYKVPVKIARLAQTFGAGVPKSDNRVFAQFARSVINGQDIILHTKGLSEGNYSYTSDTINGIFTILLKGKNGEAYNVVNESSHTTIFGMAQMVANVLAEGKIKVIFDIPDSNTFGYAADTKLNLCADKIEKLGWLPKHDLVDSYRRLIASMQTN